MTMIRMEGKVKYFLFFHVRQDGFCMPCRATTAVTRHFAFSHTQLDHFLPSLCLIIHVGYSLYVIFSLSLQPVPASCCVLVFWLGKKEKKVTGTSVHFIHGKRKWDKYSALIIFCGMSKNTRKLS